MCPIPSGRRRGNRPYLNPGRGPPMPPCDPRNDDDDPDSECEAALLQSLRLPGNSEDESPVSIPHTAVGTSGTLLAVDHRFDASGQPETIHSIEIPQALPKEQNSSQVHALIVRRVYSRKGALYTTQLEINSPAILKVLKKVVGYYPAHPVKFEKPGLALRAPYELLYHHWEELEAERDAMEEDDEVVVGGEEGFEATVCAWMHLTLLLDFMAKEIGGIRKQATEIIKSGMIDYKLLWTIFKPGALIYQPQSAPALPNSRVWRLVSVSRPEKDIQYTVQLSGVSSKDINAGRETHIQYIQPRDVSNGEYITTLPIYPLEFAPDKEEIIRAHTTRGEYYLSIRSKTIARYAGSVETLENIQEDPTYAPPPPGHRQKVWTQRNINGRIIIDPTTFDAENPHFTTRFDSEDIRPENAPRTKIEFWPKDDPLLCPPVVRGYYPSIKLWCSFYLDLITPPSWDADAFNKLILREAPKRVIRSLITGHTFPDDESDGLDQANLKGKGLVILLHGAPGTGKTLTAESVAEETHRPLMPISAGELGRTVHEIEWRLKIFLRYAALWKAVVLIDEADVFLEERQHTVSNRLEQNALVAVFLRQLEYFQGIVVLTSNRFRGFDPAIKSRMHLLLRFNAPDLEMRQNLWRLMLQRIEPDEKAFEVEEVVKLLDGLDMNGRDIGNAVSLVRTLAREEGKKVALDHFGVFRDVRGGWIEVDGAGGGLEMEG